MSKREIEPLQAHNIMLFKGDYERIQNALDGAKAGQLIRRLVRKYIKDVLEAGQTEIPDLKFED